MKLYWAEGKGAIITSANLSTSALGAGNLQELGIQVRDTDIDINRIVARIKPRAVRKTELLALEKASRRIAIVIRTDGTRKLTFAEWYELGQVMPLKLGYWTHEADFCEEAYVVSKKIYNIDEPYGYVDARKNDYKPEEDYVSFRLRQVGDNYRLFPQSITWGNVDFVVKDSSQRSAYQAVQVFSKRAYPNTFHMDLKFKRAFVAAAHEFGLGRIYNATTVLAPKKLVDLIYKHYKRQ